jgi:hypothetical protein
MKKLIITSAIAITLSLPLVLSAQNPPHPNGGSAPSGDENRVGHGPAGAPIGSGTIILTLLAAAYGGRKFYNLRKEQE